MKKISILMLATMLLAACQKENTCPASSITPVQLDGTYTGIETLTALSLVGASIHDDPLFPWMQLVISGNNFQSGSLNIYSSVGAGSFQISNGVIDFTNVDAFPGGSDFPNSGLFGNYTVKSDSVLLNKTENGVIYTYKLKKK